MPKKPIDLEVIAEKLASPPAPREPKALATGDYFKPTAKMRKLKEAFYVASRGKLPTDRSDINAEFIKRYVLTNDIDVWYTVPGFMVWFRRDESITDRLDRLYQLRLDTIEEVLEDDSNIYTVRDKLAAGAELDKITKALTDAAETLEAGKANKSKSREDMIKEALDKARATSSAPKQVAEQTVERVNQSEIVFPI